MPICQCNRNFVNETKPNSSFDNQTKGEADIWLTQVKRTKREREKLVEIEGHVPKTKEVKRWFKKKIAKSNLLSTENYTLLKLII